MVYEGRFEGSPMAPGRSAKGERSCAEPPVGSDREAVFGGRLSARSANHGR